MAFQYPQNAPSIEIYVEVLSKRLLTFMSWAFAVSSGVLCFHFLPRPCALQMSPQLAKGHLNWYSIVFPRIQSIHEIQSICYHKKSSQLVSEKSLKILTAVVYKNNWNISYVICIHPKCRANWILLHIIIFFFFMIKMCIEHVLCCAKLNVVECMESDKRRHK